MELLSQLLLSGDVQVSADELTKTASQADPPVHQATVYRTLDGLARAGVLTHVHLPIGPTTYRLANASPHADADITEVGSRPRELIVQCVHCERLVALPVEVLGKTAKRVLASSGFRLAPTHVALSGTCPDCLAAGLPAHGG